MKFLPDGGTPMPRIRGDHSETTAPESHTDLAANGAIVPHKGDETFLQLAELFDVHPIRLLCGKRRLRARIRWVQSWWLGTAAAAIDARSLHA